jgi:hypothetical protein
MSPTLGFTLVLLAAIGWASWLPLAEASRPLPVTHFMIPLYATSTVLMWLAWALFGEGGAVLEAKLAAEPSLLWLALLGGFIFIFGVWLTIVSVRLAGITVGFVLFSAMALVIGTILAAAIEGVTPGDVPTLAGGCVLILMAVPLIGYVMRERRAAPKAANTTPLPRLLGIAVLGATLVSSYPTFMALTMGGPDPARRLDAFEYMAVASTASLAAALLLAALRREPRRDVTLVQAIGMPSLAAFCHYGCNLVNAIGAAAIGFAVAWPAGQSVLVWGTLIGFLRGEFRGASMRAVGAVAGAVLLVAAGVAVLSKPFSP